MFCSLCGTQNPDTASFCARCGTRMAPAPDTTLVPGTGPSPQAPLQASGRPGVAASDLASLGQRAGSSIIDGVLQAIPYLGWIPAIINFVMFQRGTTIGLRLVSARIVRDNGDLSGFFHTAVRSWAASLSLIPLGLGYWWAFWDPMRQTWHDKLLHTYVLRDTPELGRRKGSSSTAAVAWFWALLVVYIALWILVVLVILAVIQAL